MFLVTDLSPPIFIGFYPPCVSKQHCKFALGTCPAVPPAIPLTAVAASAPCSPSLLEKSGYQFLCFDICSAVWYGGPGHLSQGMPWWCLQGGQRAPCSASSAGGARQGPSTPAAPVWQGRRTRAESHIPAELAEIWYLTTEVWYEHIETRYMESKGTEWPWPMLISVLYCCVCSVHILIDFQGMGWRKRINKNKPEWWVLWEKLLKTIFVSPRSFL